MSILTVSELVRLLRNGYLSSEELVRETIDRVRASKLKDRYVFLDEEGSIEAARASDERRKSGRIMGALEGIPYVVEDRFCTRGMPTENHCRMLCGYRPPYDATVVERLRASGAILLGKTATDGFLSGVGVGMASRSAAQMVDGGDVPFAICADTGGSAMPVGLREVWMLRLGGISALEQGLIAAAPSFDGVSLAVRSAEDGLMLLKFVCGANAFPTLEHEFHVTNGEQTSFLQNHPKTCYRILSAVEGASEMAICDGVRFGACAKNGETAQERIAQTRGAFLSDAEKRQILLGTALLMDGHREDCYQAARACLAESRRELALRWSNTDAVSLSLTEETAFLPSYLGASALAHDGELTLVPTVDMRRLLEWKSLTHREGDGLDVRPVC